MTRIKWFYKDYLEIKKSFYNTLQFRYLEKIYSSDKKSGPYESYLQKQFDDYTEYCKLIDKEIKRCERSLFLVNNCKSFEMDDFEEWRSEED